MRGVAASAAPSYAWSAFTVSVPLSRRWPPTITPPPDRRHKWQMTSERERRRWFRCSACGKRRSVTSLVSVIGDEMAQMERSIKTEMNRMLFASAASAI